MSSAVVSFSDHTLVQLFKRSHHGARGSLSTPLPFFDFSISFFSMFAFPSEWESMDWSLVPARKRTFNFWPVARGMKDVSMDGTMERKHGISRALVPPSMLRRCAARPASENAASAWSEIFSFLVGTRGLSGFKLIRVSPSKNHPAAYLSVLSFVSFDYQEFFCFL